MVDVDDCRLVQAVREGSGLPRTLSRLTVEYLEPRACHFAAANAVFGTRNDALHALLDGMYSDADLAERLPGAAEALVAALNESGEALLDPVLLVPPNSRLHARFFAALGVTKAPECVVAGSMTCLVLRQVLGPAPAPTLADSVWCAADLDVWLGDDGTDIFAKYGNAFQDIGVEVQYHRLGRAFTDAPALLRSFDLPCARVAAQFASDARQLWVSVRALLAAARAIVHLPAEMLEPRHPAQILWRGIRLPLDATVPAGKSHTFDLSSSPADVALATFFANASGTHRLWAAWSAGELSAAQAARLLSASGTLSAGGVDPTDIESAIDYCAWKESEQFGHDWEQRILRAVAPAALPSADLRRTARLTSRIDKYASRNYSFQPAPFRAMTNDEWQNVLDSLGYV